MIFRGEWENEREWEWENHARATTDEDLKGLSGWEVREDDEQAFSWRRSFLISDHAVFLSSWRETRTLTTQRCLDANISSSNTLSSRQSLSLSFFVSFDELTWNLHDNWQFSVNPGYPNDSSKHLELTPVSTVHQSWQLQTRTPSRFPPSFGVLPLAIIRYHLQGVEIVPANVLDLPNESCYRPEFILQYCQSVHQFPSNELNLRANSHGFVFRF